MEKIFCFFGHNPQKNGMAACLSQWYRCNFTVDGLQYNCMEQYMMASKAIVFHDEETLGQILVASDPKEIKALGKKVKNFNSEKWNEVKRDIVYNGNLAKFSQNPELKEFILSCGDVVFAEASPFDRIWGIGMRACEAAQNPENWKGQNLLGYALTKVKETLEKEQKSQKM